MDSRLLTNCRVIAGFKTKKEFAEALGVHPSSVTRWEAGTVSINNKRKTKVINVLTEKGLNQEEIYVLGQLKNNQKG